MSTTTPNVAPAPGTALPWTLAFEQAHDLIQEAKGADGPNGGFVTDHLDEAENWLDRAEEAANAYPALAAENARLIALVGDAYAAGQRDMKSAAIEACDTVESPFDEHSQAPENCAFFNAAESCEEAIRSIPLKDQP